MHHDDVSETRYRAIQRFEVNCIYGRGTCGAKGNYPFFEWTYPLFIKRPMNMYGKEEISIHIEVHSDIPWWRHQMETFSALLAICAGNSPVPGEFPAKRSVTRSFDVFFDRRLHTRLSKQSWGWCFETLSCPLRRHRNGMPRITTSHALQHGQKQSCLKSAFPSSPSWEAGDCSHPPPMAHRDQALDS